MSGDFKQMITVAQQLITPISESSFFFDHSLLSDIDVNVSSKCARLSFLIETIMVVVSILQPK